MEDSYQQNKSFLTGLTEGKIAIVTYYSQNAPICDVQTQEADLTMATRDDVHISWTEIRNFELRITGGFDYTYTEEDNTSHMEGEAIVLPGFLPKVGDLFLYMVRNDKIGVFTVSNSIRLALGQDTYHQIKFTMEEYLTETRRDQLKRQSQVWYFDKTKFVVGNNALLSTEGFIQQKDLRHIRKEIIVNYMDRFYSDDFSSFMRPDGIYDPYIVEYWNKKISYDDCQVRPTQLLVAVQRYHKTIWSVLTMNPIKNLKNVEKYFSTATFVSTFWGVNITSLLGNKYLAIANEPAMTAEGSTDISNSDKYNDYVPTFHSDTFKEEIRAHALRDFEIARHAFYGRHLPHQKCAPHQHPVDMPFPCDPHHCHICEFEDHHEHPQPHRHPPFPVVSTEDLFKIWYKLRRYPDEKKLHPNDYAQFQGYVLWYRDTHPGTLSARELEIEYRKSKNLLPHIKLNDSQKQAVKDYIASYRKRFLPILTDREIEYNWRRLKEIPLTDELTEEGIKELNKVIHRYRRLHGDVPSDVLENIGDAFPSIGAPYTEDEIKSLRVQSKDPHTFEQEENNEEVDDGVALVFHPRHPHPYQHIHCHSVCHRECGENACDIHQKNINDDPTYALSPAFYQGSVAMDPFEALLYRVITNQEFKVADVLTAVSTYLDWDDDLAFYRHLFALYLIDKALYWLRFHS